jgi:hypothetical protein
MGPKVELLNLVLPYIIITQMHAQSPPLHKKTTLSIQTFPASPQTLAASIQAQRKASIRPERHYFGSWQHHYRIEYHHQIP